MRSRVVWILSGAGGDSVLGGGPSCWRELSDIPVRRLGESREHILEVRERIKPATTATFNQCNRPRNPIYRGGGIGARVHAWKPGYSPIPTANASGHYA